MFEKSDLIQQIDSVLAPVQENRPTIGAISAELALKSNESRDPREIQEATEAEYLENLKQCVQINKKRWHKDFFITVVGKRERLMPNVMRNYFMARRSCPTPDYEQTLYKYNSALDQIEFVWVVPDRESLLTLLENPREVVDSERELLRFAFMFATGQLDRMCVEYTEELEKELLKEN